VENIRTLKAGEEEELMTFFNGVMGGGKLMLLFISQVMDYRMIFGISIFVC